MMRLVRLVLALIAVCGVLIAVSLLIGYISQTLIIAAGNKIRHQTYNLEVWDTGRDFRVLLAGTRCYKASSDRSDEPVEPYAVWRPILGQPFTYRVQQAIDMLTYLKCA